MLKDRTLKSLLEDPLIADIAPEAISKMDLSKEEYYSWTLREIADRMGKELVLVDVNFDIMFMIKIQSKIYT